MSILAHTGHNAQAPAVDDALRWATLGYYILPLIPGEKHPIGRLIPNGHLDATTDHATIRQWWAEWPDANIGIALETSGLIVVGPDCAERQAEFERHGLPETTTVQTGSGNGHRHYYYRRPPDCPALRICKSEDYDLIADGYAVVAPSMTTGPYVLLTDSRPVAELPVVPDWVVARLTAEHARRTTRPVVDLGTDDMPPVRLTPEAMKRWTGTYYATKADKLSVDRSTSLYILGKELARAGATPRTIAAALLERDTALNWGKYTEHANGSDRALQDACNAYAEVERERDDHTVGDADAGLLKRVGQQDQPEPASTDLTNCQDHVAELRLQLADALRDRDDYRDRLTSLERLHTATMRALSNPDLKRVTVTGLVVNNYIDNVLTDTALGPLNPDNPPSTSVSPDGAVVVPYAVISKLAGCDLDTVGKHLTALATANIGFEKRVSRVCKPERTDPQTGEILPAGWVSTTLIKRTVDHTTAIDNIADYRAPAGTPRQGGFRPRRATSCPQHPDAAQVVSTVVRCAEDREILSETPIAVIPPLKPQTAGLENVPPAVDVLRTKDPQFAVSESEDVLDLFRARMKSHETREVERGFRSYTSLTQSQPHSYPALGGHDD